MNAVTNPAARQAIVTVAAVATMTALYGFWHVLAAL